MHFVIMTKILFWFLKDAHIFKIVPYEMFFFQNGPPQIQSFSFKSLHQASINILNWSDEVDNYLVIWIKWQFFFFLLPFWTMLSFFFWSIWSFDTASHRLLFSSSEALLFFFEVHRTFEGKKWRSAMEFKCIDAFLCRDATNLTNRYVIILDTSDLRLWSTR